MYDLPRIKDLPADEIARILGDQVQQVPLPLALTVDLQVLIDEIGGIDNAYATVEMLSELETAA
jgi:hypothetical protein